METWCKISLLLCVFGFLKEIRPSEPFIYEFLSGPWRNITGDQITREVYPVATYSYLVLLAVFFLITDLLRYKPLIIVMGFAGILFTSMLIWTKSLLSLQILEVIYSIFMATEVAYYTYIYAKVDKEYYPLVTSHTRASILCGRAFSGVLAQYLISSESMDYKELQYITFTAMIAATAWSFLLPRVKQSIYFHTEETELFSDNTRSNKYNKAFLLMKSHFMQSYNDHQVIQWSFWYAVGTCCFLQVQTYMQPLWQFIVNNPDVKIYNGAVEAVLTILGVLGAILAGYSRIDWKTWGNLMLIIGCAIQGSILLLTSFTDNIYLSYICYIVFGFLYHFMITVASSEIAKRIKEDSFGLIFGFNMLIAMVFQTILTLIVVTDVFDFRFNIREQYTIYGGFTFCICALLTFLHFFNIIVHKYD